MTRARLSAQQVVDGYEILFTPLMRAAHRACFDKAQLTRDDYWPRIADILAVAKLFEVSAAELGAFFGYLSYRDGGGTVWVDVRSRRVSSWAARRYATREQAIASGFLAALMVTPRPAADSHQYPS